MGSYHPEDIIERLKQSFDEGVVEVWLTSEDTGAYGRDIGTNIVELLWKIVEIIPDGCMLRIGMTNPPYILEHLEVTLCLFLDLLKVGFKLDLFLLANSINSRSSKSLLVHSCKYIF